MLVAKASAAHTIDGRNLLLAFPALDLTATRERVNMLRWPGPPS